MHVSSQESRAEARTTGVRARTRKLLLETAMQLMQAGRVPSVTDVAEAAEVSRATAYRYFPTQAALVQAAVDEALGPILAWRSELPDAEGRIEGLLSFAYPRLDEYEATLRASGTGNVGAATAVGKLVAERAKDAGVTKVVFDRGGNLYHGRVAALADAAREAGLEL